MEDLPHPDVQHVGVHFVGVGVVVVVVGGGGGGGSLGSAVAGQHIHDPLERAAIDHRRVLEPGDPVLEGRDLKLKATFASVSLQLNLKRRNQAP